MRWGPERIYEKYIIQTKRPTAPWRLLPRNASGKFTSTSALISVFPNSNVTESGAMWNQQRKRVLPYLDKTPGLLSYSHIDSITTVILLIFTKFTIEFTNCPTSSRQWQCPTKIPGLWGIFKTGFESISTKSAICGNAAWQTHYISHWQIELP